MTLKEEIIKTLKSTSVKGVPRILSSNSVVLKAIWTIAVLAFLSICSLQVTENVLEYLEYNTFVAIEEQPYDFLNGTHDLLFPNLLVCNSNPFSGNHSAYKAAGAPLPRKYFDDVEDFLKCEGHSCEEAGGMMIDVAFGLMMSTRGYYQSVGKERASAVSHHNLVWDCKVKLFVFATVITRPCEEYGATVTKVVHPEYFNCFLIEVEQIFKVPVIGYSLILHLDNHYENANDHISKKSLPSRSAGAWISLIPKGNIPMVGPDAIGVAPGFFTSIPFRITTSSRLSRPYRKGDCETSYKNPKNKYPQYNYTQEICMAECTRDSIVEKCHCNEVNCLSYPEQNTSEYGYCMSFIDKTLPEYARNLQCLLESLDIAIHCVQKCKETCSTTNYRMWASSSKWPLPSQMMDFYKNFIENTTLEERYCKHGSIFKGMKENDGSDSDLEIWSATKSIEDNFAQVSIYMAERFIMSYVEKPKLSRTSFFSQLGGALNLWTGITVVIFIEVIDLILRVSFAANNRERKERQSFAGTMMAQPMTKSVDL